MIAKDGKNRLTVQFDGTQAGTMHAITGDGGNSNTDNVYLTIVGKDVKPGMTVGVFNVPPFKGNNSDQPGKTLYLQPATCPSGDNTCSSFPNFPPCSNKDGDGNCKNFAIKDGEYIIFNVVTSTSLPATNWLVPMVGDT